MSGGTAVGGVVTVGVVGQSEVVEWVGLSQREGTGQVEGCSVGVGLERLSARCRVKVWRSWDQC